MTTERRVEAGAEMQRSLWTRNLRSAIPLAIRVGAFVGRAAEIGRISQAIEESSALERPCVVLVSGEPGVGKSTLVAHSARLVHDSGAVLALGVCSEEVAAPFQPWRKVFELLIDRMPDDLLRGHVSASGIALATLVPALVERVGVFKPAVIEDPESERYALFAAAIDLLRRSSADAPLVVVLEDLQWADPATLALLLHLGKVGDHMRVTVVGTLRDADLPIGGPLDVAMLDPRRRRCSTAWKRRVRPTWCTRRARVVSPSPMHWWNTRCTRSYHPHDAPGSIGRSRSRSRTGLVPRLPSTPPPWRITG